MRHYIFYNNYHDIKNLQKEVEEVEDDDEDYEHKGVDNCRDMDNCCRTHKKGKKEVVEALADVHDKNERSKWVATNYILV